MTSRMPFKQTSPPQVRSLVIDARTALHTSLPEVGAARQRRSTYDGGAELPLGPDCPFGTSSAERITRGLEAR
jgi:hypothetical protein